jgi:putative nucleotidyltransferase with HDIG domain
MATRPPRLIVRTLAVTVVGVALLLSLVFIVVSLNMRRQVRQNVAATLESTQRVFAELESLRQRELRARAAILAENPTLKAAIDTFAAESQAADQEGRAQLVETVTRELEKLGSHVDADAIILVDQRMHTLAAVGPLARQWPAGSRAAFTVKPTAPDALEGILHASGAAYRAVWVNLELDDIAIGTLYVATLVDDHYAENLGRVSNAQIAVITDGRIVAATLPAAAARAFDLLAGVTKPPDGTAELNGEVFAFRRLLDIGDASFYALGSIDELSKAATAAAMRTMSLLAAGAMLLALVGSVWLARTITLPIGQLSQSVEEVAQSRNFASQLPRSGSSRELDALSDTFNDLMASVSAAEAETEAAYTGAIRALAAALDARDPYTAGHSERVSVLSVAVGRTLSLNEAELEILRLGALLHDIGKIGVPDALLRKAGALTDAEYEQIKLHPVLGARILRSVPFLSPHIPIVELHHERPDGRGYPYGLQADAIPLAARIVHVADAYDAMTSARAYRGARSTATAVEELRRCSGTGFDTAIVEAFVMSLRGLPGLDKLESRYPVSAVHA